MVDASNCPFFKVNEDDFAIFDERLCDGAIIKHGHKVDGVFGDMTEKLFTIGINVDNDFAEAWPIDSE